MYVSVHAIIHASVSFLSKGNSSLEKDSRTLSHNEWIRSETVVHVINMHY